MLSFLWGLLIFSVGLTAQEHTIQMNSGTLMIQEVNRVNIVGHSGSNVVISTTDRKSKPSEKSKGLREINAMGYKDNTGLGLAVTKDGDKVYLNQISRSGGSRYTIKVPKEVAINYEHSSWEGKTVNVEDFAGEIEVSANYNSVNLLNVSGPVAINTVYGGIEATFSKINPENSISLYSVYNNVDVSVPGNSKATFSIKTSYGKIFSDLDLKFDTDKGKMRELTNMRLKGTLNGGGADFSVKATYKNIYLRAK